MLSQYGHITPPHAISPRSEVGPNFRLCKSKYPSQLIIDDTRKYLTKVDIVINVWRKLKYHKCFQKQQTKNKSQTWFWDLLWPNSRWNSTCRRHSLCSCFCKALPLSIWSLRLNPVNMSFTRFPPSVTKGKISWRECHQLGDTLPL